MGEEGTFLMTYKLNAHDAAQKAQAMIFKGQELLIAAQRAKACGCNVIVDEKKGIFYPSSRSFHGEITSLCEEPTKNILNKK